MASAMMMMAVAVATNTTINHNYWSNDDDGDNGGNNYGCGCGYATSSKQVGRQANDYDDDDNVKWFGPWAATVSSSSYTYIHSNDIIIVQSFKQIKQTDRPKTNFISIIISDDDDDYYYYYDHNTIIIIITINIQRQQRITKIWIWQTT